MSGLIIKAGVNPRTLTFDLDRLSALCDSDDDATQSLAAALQAALNSAMHIETAIGEIESNEARV